MYDTYTEIEYLKQAGLTEEASRGVVKAILRHNEVTLGDLATKTDILVLRQEITSMESSLRQDMATKDDLKDLKHEMRWLMGLAFGILALLIKFG